MVRFSLIVLLSAALAGVTPALAAKKKPHPVPQQTIACTMAGCMPVPPGCHAEMGLTADGSPSGFEVIVCPPNR